MTVTYGFCALCTRPLRLGAPARPLGPSGSLVRICAACDREHPRDGRYAFSGGGEVSRVIGGHSDVDGHHRFGDPRRYS